MSYRQDYGPRDKPLRKWDQIGELLRKATQAHYRSERAALTLEIVSLLSPEERKSIGVPDEKIEEWGDDMARMQAVLRYTEEEMRQIAGAFQAGYRMDFRDKDGKESTYYKYMEEVLNTRSRIDWNVCRVLRLIYEICESKGVKVSQDVALPGPRGQVLGVSRIVGERVEVEAASDKEEAKQ